MSSPEPLICTHSGARRRRIDMHTRSKNALRRGLARRITMALFGTLLLSAGAAPALAAEVRQGDSVVVGPNETINDDLYAFGSTVTILGTVNGDVFTRSEEHTSELQSHH